LQNREGQQGAVYPTIQDVASSGHWVNYSGAMRFRQTPFARDAQEIERLNQDQYSSRLNGNTERADQDRVRANQLKERLENAGVTSPELTLDRIRDHVAATQKELVELNKQLASGKVVVTPRNGGGAK
jgi:hypothetical protein